MYLYDSIIIGAGVAGASIAFALTGQNQKVLVVDKNGIATGGSGAAGAFVSPKIGKGSGLQTLTNEAFEYAKEFYLSTCPKYFHQTGVVRIPKNEEDDNKFTEYKKYNNNKYEVYTKKKLNALGINVNFDSFYFSEAGDCDAVQVCQYLLENIEVVQLNVTSLLQVDGFWSVGKYKAKNIVLATGYESDLVDLRYMGIKGTWGTRGDFCSSLDLNVSMHQSMSVGANVNGVIKLGATHEKEVKEVVPCERQEALNLKENASVLIDTEDFELKDVFCGMRAGSKDYFPLVGKVIDIPFMLENYPSIVRGGKADLRYINNLYVLNGLGGRGFVFAPLMAKMLAEHMLEDKELEARVNPDRLFYKWARRLK